MPWQEGPWQYNIRVPGASTGPTRTLYPPGSGVRVLTGEVLVSHLDADPGSWHFLELYDHMCPHCWFAVPIVTALAKGFRDTDKVEIMSLNCHVQENQEACFFLEVIAGAVDFPTFLMCAPADGKHVEETLEALPSDAQNLYPRLRPEQKQFFLHLTRCRLRFIEPSVPEGKEDELLSAKPIAAWISHQVREYPPHPEALTAGADFARMSRPDPRAPPGRPGWLRDDIPGEPGMQAWVPGQRWYDALIGYLQVISIGYRAAHHDDVIATADFLSKAFPVKGHAFRNLAERFRNIGPQHDPAVVRQMIRGWTTDSSLPDPGGASYLTCSVDTCAMWTLLHVAVAAVAARGVTGEPLLVDGSALADSSSGEIPSTSVCMNFVRTMVNDFLTCGKCKLTFLEEYGGCEYGRCNVGPTDYRGLVLWLWRAHNAVSLHSAQQHQAQTDRRWPMYEDCPMCWKTDVVLGKDDKDDHDADFDRRLREQPWERTDLDHVFHVRHVFWHIIRTYIGLSRLRLGKEDLTPEEQLQIERAMPGDRKREEVAAAARPAHHAGFVESPPPPEEVSTVTMVASGLIILLAARACMYYKRIDGWGNAREPIVRQVPPEEETEALADEEELTTSAKHQEPVSSLDAVDGAE